MVTVLRWLALLVLAAGVEAAIGLGVGAAVRAAFVPQQSAAVPAIFTPDPGAGAPGFPCSPGQHWEQEPGSGWECVR
jgi:hypothetical protein